MRLPEPKKYYEYVPPPKFGLVFRVLKSNIFDNFSYVKVKSWPVETGQPNAKRNELMTYTELNCAAVAYVFGITPLLEFSIRLLILAGSVRYKPLTHFFNLSISSFAAQRSYENAENAL